MPVKRCKTCGRPAVAARRYGDRDTIDRCPACDPEGVTEGVVARPDLVVHDARQALAGGDRRAASDMLRHAVHVGADPADLLIAATAMQAPERAPTPLPDGTVDEVLDWVGGDPVDAALALHVEQQRGRPRRTLVDRLQQLTAG